MGLPDEFLSFTFMFFGRLRESASPVDLCEDLRGTLHDFCGLLENRMNHPRNRMCSKS